MSKNSKKALVVVDYQNDFIDGSLGFDGAEILKNEILRLCSDFDGDLIFTFDTHDENYLNTKEGKNLPIKHCLKNSKGWKMPEEFSLFLKKAECIFEKSSFGSLEFAQFCREKNYDSIEFCGLVSHICVFQNIILVSNACENARIVLHKNATASFDKELENHAFEMLKAFWVEFV